MEGVNKSRGSHYWSRAILLNAARIWSGCALVVAPAGPTFVVEGFDSAVAGYRRPLTGTATVELTAQWAMWSVGDRVGRWGDSIILIAHRVRWRFNKFSLYVRKIIIFIESANYIVIHLKRKLYPSDYNLTFESNRNLSLLLLVLLYNKFIVMNDVCGNREQ